MKELQLTRGLIAKVDDEDFPAVLALGRWQARKCGREIYASTDVNKRTILLHRFVMKVDGSAAAFLLRVDHINFDTLDCQKQNLRILSTSENALNRKGLQPNNISGVNGVYWNSQKRKWHAEIRIETKKIHLGFFDSLEAAKEARQRKEKELWDTISQRR